MEKYRDQTIEKVTGTAISEEIYLVMSKTLDSLRSQKDGDK